MPILTTAPLDRTAWPADPPCVPLPPSPRLTFLPILIAAAVVLLHLLTNNRYGFHRDELQFLSDGRHLDWGYVVYPPLTPLLARLAFLLFGQSLLGFRLFAVLAQAAATLVAARITRDVGGQRFAQAAAALAVALSPISIHYGTELIYSSFDYLWWILTAWFLVRLVNSANPRWWLAIGTTLGIAFTTKYTVAVFIAGLMAALFFTPLRTHLRSRFLWIGVGIACLLSLPNLIWQLRHQFISLHWMHSIHLRDLGLGRDQNFLLMQVVICVNLVATPLWIAGLIACLRSTRFRRYRPLAWMYFTPLVLLMLMRARDYYLAPAYPMLIAVGAAAVEAWMAKLGPVVRRALTSAWFLLLTAYALVCIIQIVPLASTGTLRDFTLAHSYDLREEIGWPEMVASLSSIRDTLPASSQARTAILVGNYGEAGAVELFGPGRQLPPLINGTNSGWLRGYPAFEPSTLIVVGLTRSAAEGWLTSCRPAGKVSNSLGISNLETDPLRSTIFVCGPPRLPWPIFWKQFRSFG